MVTVACCVMVITSMAAAFIPAARAASVDNQRQAQQRLRVPCDFSIHMFLIITKGCALEIPGRGTVIRP
jgi:hypothetical protein